MIMTLRFLFDLAGTVRVFRLLLLSALGAATEGVGLMLLVPLVASLAGGASLPDLGISLPRWPLGVLLAAFVVLVLVRAAVEIARSLASQDLSAKVVDGLRRRAVSALLGAEWHTLSQMHQSANRALLITSIDRVGEAVDHASTILRTGVSLAVLGLAGFALSPAVAAGGAVAGIFVLASLRALRRDARRLGEALSRQYEAIYRRLEQTLSALRLVKSFGREDSEAAALAKEFTRLREAERRYVLGSALARAALQVGSAIALALVVWLAVSQWHLATPVLLTFIALAVRAVPLAEALQSAAQGWAHAAPAFEESWRLIADAEAAAEQVPQEDAPRLRRAITLTDVSYRHATGRRGVRDITITLAAGSVTALVGPSGSGKSTLADLIGGLLSPDSGQLAIDGIKLTGGKRNAWRRRVAYVQQEPVLYSGTIRSNLLWAAPDAGEEMLRAALARAAADFVHTLPGGLDCPLGEGGRALSGGERQRIALARALLREPDLLILDEATSAVDSVSEQAIVEAVRALAGRCTVLVIGHRGALVGAAERWFALEGGRLAQG